MILINASPRLDLARSRLCRLALYCALGLLVLGCTGCKPKATPDPATDVPEGVTTQGQHQPGGQSAAATAGEADKTEKKPMSGDKSSLLNRINELLAAHPAKESDCGDKHTQLRREDDLLIAEVTLSECERSYRFEAPIAKLLFDNMETELAPEHGRGQVYILCQNDESCAVWKIRDNSGAEWRTVRDDPEFVIDLAPDANAVATLEQLLGEWRGG